MPFSARCRFAVSSSPLTRYSSMRSLPSRASRCRASFFSQRSMLFFSVRWMAALFWAMRSARSRERKNSSIAAEMVGKASLRRWARLR